jgi:nitrous oxidase accessory protein NosD
MALIQQPKGEPMTLLTERPATSSTETTLKTAAGTSVAGTAVRGGSYVTLPAGSAPAGVEGNYVAGVRNLPSATRGSYVTADGTPVVAARVIEGSYVTLPAAA